MPPSVDAGYVTQSALYDGRTLYRHTDEEASREAGYEILEDNCVKLGIFPVFR